MEQLLCHIAGDYLLQSDYLAMNKNKKSLPCLIHVLIYTSVFLFLTSSWKALLVIGGVHFILDRFPVIIKRLIWTKNHLNFSLSYVPYKYCQYTGYYDNVGNDIGASVDRNTENISGNTPRLNYVTVWLYIITDNFLHLLTNYLALKYFL